MADRRGKETITSHQSLARLMKSGDQPFRAKDEEFHPAPDNNPHWGETSWWVFTSPDENLIGWVYMLFRHNIGVASVGIWVWDNSASEARNLLYSKSFIHVPIDAATSLLSLRFPESGLQFAMDIEEPLRKYHMTYQDMDEITLDLNFRGIIDPVGLGISETTGHCDQPLWVSGSIEVDGRAITVDGPAFRDRTWAHRPEYPTSGISAYSWGAVDDFAFLSFFQINDDGEPVHCFGFLWKDGELAPVVENTRKVLERRDDGCAVKIHLSATDSQGRSIHAIGECNAGAAISPFAGITSWDNLVKWQIDDRVIWGEDHDNLPNSHWRELLQS